MIKLPIPIFRDDKIYREVEIDKPIAKVVSETHKTAQSGLPFKSALDFLKNCVVSIDNITDKVSIASLMKFMPIRSAEYVADQIMVLYHSGDDGIEGYYPCPLCETPTISMYQKEGDIEIDTRDFLSDMKISFMEEDNDNNFIFRELIKPVTIKDKDTGNILEEITSVKMKYPTLENGIVAERKCGIINDIKTQYGIYVEALTEINGSKSENKWKNRYGMFFFENVREVKEDLGYIQDEIEKYGRDRTLRKECQKCGKIWKATPKSSNFFVSALRTGNQVTES